MKITAIETLQWTAYPRLLIVRVHTDSGLIGLGETVDKIPAAKAALHGTIAPLALGQDPLDIEGLWRFVMDNIMYHGYAGAETRALSAFEVALWDIMGKALWSAALSPARRQDPRRNPHLQHLSQFRRCPRLRRLAYGCRRVGAEPAR